MLFLPTVYTLQKKYRPVLKNYILENNLTFNYQICFERSKNVLPLLFNLLKIHKVVKKYLVYK